MGSVRRLGAPIMDGCCGRYIWWGPELVHFDDGVCKINSSWFGANFGGKKFAFLFLIVGMNICLCFRKIRLGALPSYPLFPKGGHWPPLLRVLFSSSSSSVHLKSLEPRSEGLNDALMTLEWYEGARLWIEAGESHCYSNSPLCQNPSTIIVLLPSLGGYSIILNYC